MSTQKQGAFWRHMAWLLCVVCVMWAWSGVGCTPSKPETGNETTADAASGDEPTKQEPAPTGTDAAPKENPPSSDEPTKTSLTWHKDIQPIMQQNCQVCHQKGGVGPFALSNYEEVKAQGATVKWSVETRRMPPWMPENTDDTLPLAHNRRLSQEDVDKVVQWVKGGMPKGDPKDGTTYTPKEEKLDWVDADVDTQQDYTPPANRPDDYHCFMTKPILEKGTKQLIGFRFIPGVKEMVHHVLIYGVTTSYSDTLKAKHPENHWPCSTGALINNDAIKSKSKLIGVWVPGTDVIHFPKGTGMEITPGERLVLEFHYNSGAMDKPLPDRSRIQLQYAKTPVKYQLQLAAHIQSLLAIPPDSKGFEASKDLSLKGQKVRVWGFMPHMHKYGTKFKVEFQTPYKGKKYLVNIKRWDYNWQQTFFFKNPEGILMDGSEILKMTCTYDNPTGNLITWGDKTNDEMCLNFYFTSAP